jgi:hypothetical protein
MNLTQYIKSQCEILWKGKLNISKFIVSLVLKHREIFTSISIQKTYHKKHKAFMYNILLP